MRWKCWSLLVACVFGPGCGLMPTGQTQTGWSFSVGTPTVVHVPTVVTQGPADPVPLNLGSQTHPLQPVEPVPPQKMPVGAAAGGANRVMRGAAGDCDLSDVCDRLDKIERKISRTNQNQD